MNPRTCVITVNYRGANDTAACLESLENSTVPVNKVVVDNTPNDPALIDVIEKYESLKIIRAPDNLGFGRGNNLGIAWALDNTSCEFIFILNNDATVKPNTVNQMEAAMDLHPEAGVVAARIVLSEDKSKLWYGGGEIDWKRGSGKVPGFLGPSDDLLAVKARYVSFASGCAMMIRRDVLNELGGFDKRFFMYEEDLELSLRIRQAGWDIWYESSALISHLGQGSQETRSKFISRFDPKNPNLGFLVYHGIKNCLLNMDMHARSLDRLKFFVFFPVFLILKFVQWARYGRVDAIKCTFRAIRDFRKER